MSEAGGTTAAGTAGSGAAADGTRSAARDGAVRFVPAQAAAAQVVEGALRDAGLEWESTAPGAFVVTLPGVRKLSTTLSLIVGRHSLSLNAFVVRHPDENEQAVHRWLLERNLKLYGVCYAVDRLGDIYVTGRLPLAAVTEDEIDRLLGQVLEAADGSFNTLLELGFASSIRKEYAWRVSRGESTRNLDAFTHLTRDVATDPPVTDTGAGDGAERPGTPS
ncbi:YbjN domain-containing protein [Streptomyces sp. NPDC090306]|uniref:YbjN domain-containing protein n=1 Tax=Streptomyces sp. NPDC090306 TaxID=3365961 RepID=UPI0038133765